MRHPFFFSIPIPNLSYKCTGPLKLASLNLGLVTTKSFIVLPSEVRLLINSVISFFVEPNWEFGIHGGHDASSGLSVEHYITHKYL